MKSFARVELFIEELVLSGFPSLDRYAVAESMERELVALIAERGFSRETVEKGGAAFLDGGRFESTPGSDPSAIGAQVACAVYGGLSR